MKKLVAVLMFILFCMFISPVYAEDKSLTFVWEQPGDDLTDLDHWVLYQSSDEAAAEPWTKVGEVPFTGGEVGETYTATFTVTVPADAETSLYFRMTAVDKAGLTSDYSESAIPAPVIIDFKPPATPVGLAGQYNNQTKEVTLTWTQDAADIDIANWKVHKAGVSGGPYDEVGEATGPHYVYGVQPSDSGKWLYFVVVAFDSNGNFSTNSDEEGVKLTMGVPFGLRVNIVTE